MYNRETDEDAVVISVEDDFRINVLGNALAISGSEASARTDSLPGTVNRYKVRFQLSDREVLETIITGKNIDRYIVGDHGRLIYRGNVVLSWK